MNIFKSAQAIEEDLFCANSIIRIQEKMGFKLFAITSSKYSKTICAIRLAESLIKRGKKVLIIKPDFSDEMGSELTVKDLFDSEYTVRSVNNVQPEVLEEYLKLQNEKFDFVIINLPSVRISACALQIAAICDTVILAEKTRFSTHKAFEETVQMLNETGVNICGAINCR